jgi:hypothetical protein
MVAQPGWGDDRSTLSELATQRIPRSIPSGPGRTAAP